MVFTYFHFYKNVIFGYILIKETQTNMANAIINFNKASIGYSAEEPVLQNVTFTLAQGEVLYLIGKTAAGKSSLLKTMYSEIAPLGGEVHVADFDLLQIKDSNIPFLRRKVALVFQDFQLLTDRSVYENLLFVLKATGWKKLPDINERIDEVLSQVGILSKKNSMPHQLSGGEQQRVVIARALLNYPDIILADEPTGNLDPETSDEIFNVLHSIAKMGCAVFFVTHNHQLMKKYPARILECKSNTVTEIFEQENVIDFGALMD